MFQITECRVSTEDIQSCDTQMCTGSVDAIHDADFQEARGGMTAKHHHLHLYVSWILGEQPPHIPTSILSLAW